MSAGSPSRGEIRGGQALRLTMAERARRDADTTWTTQVTAFEPSDAEVDGWVAIEISNDRGEFCATPRLVKDLLKAIMLRDDISPMLGKIRQLSWLSWTETPMPWSGLVRFPSRSCVASLGRTRGSGGSLWALLLVLVATSPSISRRRSAGSRTKSVSGSFDERLDIPVEAQVGAALLRT